MKKRSKKSQSNIIAIVLIILLILALIIIIWNLVSALVKKNTRISELTAKTMSVRIKIDNVVGDLVNPAGDKLDITVSRGQENIRTIPITRTVDVDVKWCFYTDTYSVPFTDHSPKKVVGGVSYYCCDLQNVIKYFLDHPSEAYAVIIVGNKNSAEKCGLDLNPDVSVNVDVVKAKNVQMQGIPVHTVSINGVVDPEPYERTFEAMAGPDAGQFYKRSIGLLNDIYNRIKQETIIEPENKWDHIKAVVYGDTNYISEIRNVLNPMETRTYTIATGGVRNIYKIEIYLVAYTSQNEEVTKLLDTWTP